MRRFLVRDAEDPKTMATFYRQNSGSLCATLWQLILGTDRRFDETTSKFSKEMLPRIDRRKTEEGEWICQKSEEVLKKAGVLTIEEYIQRRRIQS
jgi:hypothetical protein